MNQLKMNPSRDAGRFAYHLKFMLKADLVEADVEAKKYYLTDLGKMVLDVSDRIEKKAVKTRGMLVRTSHLTLEEFDSNKIANSLIKEAKVPAELAQKAAKEAEKRLTKSKIKYLTASLIREVVNGILIEKGYEEYRQKLTRVGMPIHEVTTTVEAKISGDNASNILTKAGQAVLGEYTLLNIFPRDIADAHMSGAIHMDNLGVWILKPDEVTHDQRFFFRNGVKLDNLFKASMEPPNSFEAALTITFNVLLHGGKEANVMQTCNNFNVFLSPFAQGVQADSLKENLRFFLLNLNQNVDVTLGLDISMPNLTGRKEAIGVQGKVVGKYVDFSKESSLLASLTLDIFAEESNKKPLFNPRLVIKISSNFLFDDDAKAILLKAHKLSVEKGTVYFADLTKKDMENTVFSASGFKLTSDLTADWETDTLRTGCLGSVTINLPRIVQECEKDANKFFDLVKERCELAARALVIKYNAFKQFGRNLLPFLLKSSNEDTYFRIENCSRLINLAGFKEAVEAFTGKTLNSEEGHKFAEELAQVILAFKQKVGRKYGRRLYPVILTNSEASERLAQLDIEKYGLAKVKFSGSRDRPFYSTTKRYQVKTGESFAVPVELFQTSQKIKGLSAGGTLDVFELDSMELSPESLMSFTELLIETQSSEFFIYNRIIGYCNNCGKSWFGKLHKCPSCGSMSAIVAFDRFNST